MTSISGHGRSRREGRSADGPRSVAELVVTELRRRIITGALPLGEHISEQRLADDLDVGRSSLREALRILEADGLIQHIPRAGSRVITISLHDELELVTLREHLEGLAISAGVPAPDATRLALLHDTVVTLETRAAAGHEESAAIDTLAFHRALVGLPGMTRLDAAYDTIAFQLGILMQRNRRRTADAETLVERAARHRRLYELVLTGDPDAVSVELAKHRRRHREDRSADQ